LINDFSKATKNRYAKQLKKKITIRLDNASSDWNATSEDPNRNVYGSQH